MRTHKQYRCRVSSRARARPAMQPHCGHKQPGQQLGRRGWSCALSPASDAAVFTPWKWHACARLEVAVRGHEGSVMLVRKKGTMQVRHECKCNTDAAQVLNRRAMAPRKAAYSDEQGW